MTSPLPWKYGKQTPFGQRRILDASGRVVATALRRETADFDAALIVKGVNGNGKVLAMLKRVYEAEYDWGAWPDKEEIETVIAEAESI